LHGPCGGGRLRGGERGEPRIATEEDDAPFPAHESPLVPPPENRTMPRRYDERDDYDEQLRRPSTSPVLILALVLGGLLVLGVVGCGVFGFLAFRAAPGRPGGD
jgi:hypothetical protein